MDPLAPAYSGRLTATQAGLSVPVRTPGDTTPTPPGTGDRQRQPGGSQAVSDRVSFGQQQDAPAEFRPYGPDGRTPPLPSGAVPATNKEASTPSALPQSPGSPADRTAQTKSVTGRSAANPPADAKGEGDPQIQQEIAQLKATEEKVKAHEAAHKAAGGSMTGPVSYSYTRGPDGRSYVTGGEVPISVSPGKTPQETISRMQQVIQAALAPADPSPQDRAVAAQATAQLQEAQQQQAEKSGTGTGKPADSSSGNATAASNDSTSAVLPEHGERDKGADSLGNSPPAAAASTDRAQPTGARVDDGSPGAILRRSDRPTTVTAASGAHVTAPQGGQPRIGLQVAAAQADTYPTPDSLTGFAPARPLSVFA